MEEIAYTYTIDEISDDGTTAVVTYTADDERLKPVTRNVPTVVHKARNLEHAREILHQKAKQRAPVNEWLRALQMVDDPPSRVDVEQAVADIRDNVVGASNRVEPERPKTEEERLRERFLADAENGDRPGRGSE